MIHGLYAITNERLMPGELLLRKAEAALQGGCRLIQYRNKQGPWVQRLREAQALRTVCHLHGAILIINDSPELAEAVAADGVHLGQEDATLAEARKRLGSEAIIGATCHASLQLAEVARQSGASYLAFGRFFSSHTKPQAPPADLPLLNEVKQRLRLPTVAIGGINVDNAAALIAAGADCLAVCHDLFSSDDLAEIRRRAQQYSSLFTTAQELS